jgi:GNAT superfamily N-acetyltransferase
MTSLHGGLLGNTDASATAPTATEAQLGHRTLLAFNRALTHWSSRGALLETGGVVLCASGTWIPVVANGAFRTDDSLNANAVVTAADAFFAGLQRGFTVKVRDSGEDDDLRLACEEAGLEAFGDPVPEMVCSAPLPDATPVDGVTLRIVDDEAGVREFVSVNAEAYATYGMPTEVLADVFDEVAAVLADPTASIVVARRAGQPVATAMVYESDGVASLQWVGTVPAARGAGLGALVTEAVTNLAFDHGASSCSLQASPMGAAIYHRLGYETVFHYEEYVRWPKPAPR